LGQGEQYSPAKEQDLLGASTGEKKKRTLGELLLVSIKSGKSLEGRREKEGEKEWITREIPKSKHV